MKWILASALLVVLSACALLPTDSGIKTVRLRRDFTLSEGQRAVVREPRLLVEFVEVLEDDRCREGTLCFGIGTYMVRLRASMDGAAPQTLDVLSRFEGYASYGGYTIQVRQLLPDPPPNQGEPDEYSLRLRVDRGSVVID